MSTAELTSVSHRYLGSPIRGIAGVWMAQKGLAVGLNKEICSSNL